MLLTKKALKSYLEQNRISISKEKESELLQAFGKPVIDDEGHLREYTEQDIYEQIRKLL